MSVGGARFGLGGSIKDMYYLDASLDFFSVVKIEYLDTLLFLSKHYIFGKIKNF